jgi:hypothetical protein
MICDLGMEELELQLFVLKCHLITERVLYGLLSLRLGTAERELPQLSFALLAKIALSSKPYNKTLPAVLALNGLRNEYSHELVSDNLNSRMQSLAECAGVSWPSKDKVDLPSLWPQACDRAVRMAAGLSLGDVWAHIVEAAVAQKLYSSDSALADAQRELNSFKALQAERRNEEESLNDLYKWLVQQLASLDGVM